MLRLLPTVCVILGTTQCVSGMKRRIGFPGYFELQNGDEWCSMHSARMIACAIYDEPIRHALANGIDMETVLVHLLELTPEHFKQAEKEWNNHTGTKEYFSNGHWYTCKVLDDERPDGNILIRDLEDKELLVQPDNLRFGGGIQDESYEHVFNNIGLSFGDNWRDYNSLLEDKKWTDLKAKIENTNAILVGFNKVKTRGRTTYDQSHYFAFVKYGDTWWNVDSEKPAPDCVGDNDMMLKEFKRMRKERYTKEYLHGNIVTFKTIYDTLCFIQPATIKPWTCVRCGTAENNTSVFCRNYLTCYGAYKNLPKNWNRGYDYHDTGYEYYYRDGDEPKWERPFDFTEAYELFKQAEQEDSDC